MSIPARDWAWAQRLPAARKLVLLHLADRHNPKFGYAFPSIADTAERCGITPSQARRHIRALQDDGLVEVRLCRWESGANASNRYYLLMPTLAPMPDGASMDATLPLHVREGGLAPAQERDSVYARETLASTQAKPEVEPVGEPDGDPGELTVSAPAEGPRAPARKPPAAHAATIPPLRAREAHGDTAAPESVGTVLLAPSAPPSLSSGSNHLYDAEGRRIPTPEEVAAAEASRARQLAAIQARILAQQSAAGD
jgi:DNA-binding transcriptional ArsR family regulator